MTLPYEEARALNNTREFLRSLLDPKQTPRVARKIRHEAYWCLRHYPWPTRVDELYRNEVKDV